MIEGYALLETKQWQEYIRKSNRSFESIPYFEAATTTMAAAAKEWKIEEEQCDQITTLSEERL